MSIPRRPVPLSKDGPEPTSQISLSSSTALTPQSTHLTDAGAHNEAQVTPVQSRGRAGFEPESPPTSQPEALQPDDAKPKPLSDIFAADSLSHILSAYTSNSEDSTMTAQKTTMAPTTQAITSTDTDNTPMEAIKRKTLPGASFLSLSSDALGYDYSVLTQYQSQENEAQQAHVTSNTLQIPGSAGLPKSPRSVGGGTVDSGNQENNSTLDTGETMVDRPVSVMTDLLSTYSSLPSNTPTTPASFSLASPATHAPSPPIDDHTGQNGVTMPSSESTNTNVSLPHSDPTSPPHNQSIEPQLWRRRSVKNDVPLQVPTLILHPTTASFAPNTPVSQTREHGASEARSPASHNSSPAKSTATPKESSTGDYSSHTYAPLQQSAASSAQSPDLVTDLHTPPHIPSSADIQTSSENTLYFPKQATSVLKEGSVLPAPKLRRVHFDCLHRHERMIRVSNKHYPLTCQTCEKAETDDFARCPWCALRICVPCSSTLKSVRGDVSRLLDALHNNPPEA
ncbi:Serine-rich adhesin for platelets [Ceratocystis lukuohia]|uniref:Serine-rich adhesin for platelets n=1 Tax=Ceratocystis lukuohia TaxID=2019550 RepID=A0ABR4MB85_9PEZI